METGEDEKERTEDNKRTKIKRTTEGPSIGRVVEVTRRGETGLKTNYPTGI